MDQAGVWQGDWHKSIEHPWLQGDGPGRCTSIDSETETSLQGIHGCRVMDQAGAQALTGRLTQVNRVSMVVRWWTRQVHEHWQRDWRKSTGHTWLQGDGPGRCVTGRLTQFYRVSMVAGWWTRQVRDRETDTSLQGIHGCRVMDQAGAWALTGRLTQVYRASIIAGWWTRHMRENWQWDWHKSTGHPWLQGDGMDQAGAWALTGRLTQVYRASMVAGWWIMQVHEHWQGDWHKSTEHPWLQGDGPGRCVSIDRETDTSLQNIHGCRVMDQAGAWALTGRLTQVYRTSMVAGWWARQVHEHWQGDWHKSTGHTWLQGDGMDQAGLSIEKKTDASLHGISGSRVMDQAGVWTLTGRLTQVYRASMVAGWWTRQVCEHWQGDWRKSTEHPWFQGDGPGMYMSIDRETDASLQSIRGCRVMDQAGAWALIGARLVSFIHF